MQGDGTWGLVLPGDSYQRDSHLLLMGLHYELLGEGTELDCLCCLSMCATVGAAFWGWCICI